MNTTMMEIGVNKPVGRTILRELETQKIHYSQPESIRRITYSVDEVFDECYDILSKHYNCNVSV